MVKHEIDVRKTPIGYQLRCDCGWTAFVPKQNALARAKKIQGKCTEHKKSVGEKQ